MSFLRQGLDDLSDITNKTHVEHAIRFVENKILNVRQIDVAFTNVIKQSPRCRDNDIDAHMAGLCEVYRSRRDAAMAAIEEFFPAEVEYTRPEGGYFIWLTVPGLNATEMLPRAMNEIGVAYVPGESFFANADQSCNIRLSYSQMTEENIREGMARLATLINNL